MTQNVSSIKPDRKNDSQQQKKTLFMFCRVSAEAAVAATIAIQNQNVNRNLLS